jgi:hypothetical protein
MKEREPFSFVKKRNVFLNGFTAYMQMISGKIRIGIANG